jgi:hypothetical protein
MLGKQIPELTEGSEEGFTDLCLRMGGLLLGADRKYRFEAKASHRGRAVDFAVELSSTGFSY